MQQLGRVGIVGCGPSAVYLLKHILDQQRASRLSIDQLFVFEREPTLGHGMPYNPRTTDRFNLCNISSAEIPAPCQTFADWLKSQPDDVLDRFDLRREDINCGETYGRKALGSYYNAQYHALADELRRLGTEIIEHAGCLIVDLIDEGDVVVVVDSEQARYKMDHAIISTGHAFATHDKPDAGYFASPWPIKKLLPDGQEYLNFTIGLLGASLSALDVIASLSHRHGAFEKSGSAWRYEPHAGAEQFRIIMHAANGWLPHLQYEQVEPFREIYRHATRAQVESLIDADGFLSLQKFFDSVCRPALADAFDKDARPDIAQGLRSSTLSLKDFVNQMTAEHEYDDPFQGMKSELPEADRSVNQDHPIHWKETLDDLMYCLNFHAERLSAEDHRRFRKVIQPFLMNVIAAMPLQSARTLLALHDAGKLEIVAGLVEVDAKHDGETVIEVEDNGERTEHRYRMFVDCSGQEPVRIETYPFRSLVRSGSVVAATAAYRNGLSSPEQLPGIAIDAAYRVIGSDGQSNLHIRDIALTHTAGYRPYSYGLQACNETAAIVVEALCSGTRQSSPSNRSGHFTNPTSL